MISNSKVSLQTFPRDETRRSQPFLDSEIRFARVQRNIDETHEAHRGGLAGGLSKAPPASLSPLRDHLTGKRTSPSFHGRFEIASAVFLGYLRGAHRTRRPRVVQVIGMPWTRKGGIRSAALLDLSNSFLSLFPRNLIGCVYVYRRMYGWRICV